MAEQDKKIQREILKWLYERFNDDPLTEWGGNEIFESLSEYSREDIIYNVERLNGEFLENEPTMSSKVARIQITPAGIEELYSQGYETILESDTRYEILRVLYQAIREDPGWGYIDRDQLIAEADANEDEVDQNIWYLKEKRFVETRGGGGGLFYHQIKITQSGSERFEQFEEDGVEIPRIGSRQKFRQASIGPGESGKAENLFRDFAELARDEVIIIDRFAREGLYDLLQHVPKGVEIKVVTTDRVTGGGYQKRVNQFVQNHSTIEVRFLPDSDWDFHDRYVIRDREDGWAWGHSFHDAGDTQHTASELRPINRETIIGQFENAWQKGSVIV
ncbi:phospholipase D-like domain-containing protein [Natrialba magadii]|nr:hypothetical protein [Natrialba magadii]